MAVLVIFVRVSKIVQIYYINGALLKLKGYALYFAFDLGKSFFCGGKFQNLKEIFIPEKKSKSN